MTTKQVVCYQCRNVFERSLARVNEAIANGSKQLCSKVCIKEYHTTKVEVPCSFCSKGLQVQQSVFLKSTTKRFFCNNSCSAQFNNKLRVRTLDSKAKVSCSVASYLVEVGRPSLTRVCSVCKTEYKVENAIALRGGGLHCSRACANVARSGIPQYSKEELIQVLKDLFQKNKFITSKLVPFAIRYQANKLFGSWKETLGAAGLGVASNNRSKKCYACHDGHEADSAEEAFLDNWLSSRGISHEINKYYPETTLTCDFYLPEYDLWVEYLGLYVSTKDYQAKFDKKRALATAGGFTLVGLLAKDIRKGVEGVDSALSSHLLEKKEPRTYLGRQSAPTLVLPCKFCGNPFTKLERKHRSDVKSGASNFFCCKSHQVKYQHSQRKVLSTVPIMY